MTTPSGSIAQRRSERVTFQIQTRAELGPFRDYGPPSASYADVLAVALDACKFSESVRILALLTGAFYGIVWVDGIDQGSPELHHPEVAAAMRSPEEQRAAAVRARTFGLVSDLRAELDAREDSMTPYEWAAAEALFRLACERFPVAPDEIIRREIDHIWDHVSEMSGEEFFADDSELAESCTAENPCLVRAAQGGLSCEHAGLA